MLCDERDTTPSDFTIRVKGLPKKLSEDSNADLAETLA